MKTCQYWVLDEDEHEVPCGKPAVCYIIWPGGPKGNTTYWYCAEHYDNRIADVWDCGRRDVLKLSGAL